MAESAIRRLAKKAIKSNPEQLGEERTANVGFLQFKTYNSMLALKLTILFQDKVPQLSASQGRMAQEH